MARLFQRKLNAIISIGLFTIGTLGPAPPSRGILKKLLQTTRRQPSASAGGWPSAIIRNHNTNPRQSRRLNMLRSFPLPSSAPIRDKVEAGERLSLEGWPRASKSPESHRCPKSANSPQFRPREAQERQLRPTTTSTRISMPPTSCVYRCVFCGLSAPICVNRRVT